MKKNELKIRCPIYDTCYNRESCDGYGKWEWNFDGYCRIRKCAHYDRLIECHQLVVKIKNDDPKQNR